MNAIFGTPRFFAAGGKSPEKIAVMGHLVFMKQYLMFLENFSLAIFHVNKSIFYPPKIDNLGEKTPDLTRQQKML